MFTAYRGNLTNENSVSYPVVSDFRSYWERNVCLKINIFKCLVLNLNMSNFHDNNNVPDVIEHRGQIQELFCLSSAIRICPYVYFGISWRGRCGKGVPMHRYAEHSMDIVHRDDTTMANVI